VPVISHESIWELTTKDFFGSVVGVNNGDMSKWDVHICHNVPEANYSPLLVQTTNARKPIKDSKDADFRLFFFKEKK